MKVVYTGFLKTGSRSICDFSKKVLGYEVYQGNRADLHSHPTDIIFKNMFTINTDDLLTCFHTGMVKNKDIYNFMDKNKDLIVKEFPYFGMYKYIYEKYDDSKFIICIRDTDKTFESYKKFMNDYMPHMYHKINKALLGIKGPITEEHRDRFKLVYEAHNFKILNFFKDKPGKLLVLDFEEIGTDDFENKISNFLGVDKNNVKMGNLKSHEA